MNSTDSTQIIDDDYLQIWYNIILAPIINYLYDEFNKYFDKYEDNIFNSVYPHDGVQINFQLCKLPEVLPFISYLIPAIDQMLICCTFGWFTYITFKYACTKKKPLEKLKSVCMLGIKFILSFLFLTILSFSAVATYKMAFKLDWTLRNFIRTGCDVINDIHYGKTKFELQLHDVNMSVLNTLLLVENTIYNLPENIYEDTYDNVKKELNNATKSYNNIMMKSEFLFDQSGLKIIHDKIEQNMEKELRITEKLMIMFNNNTKILISNITEDVTLDKINKQTILHDIDKIEKYTDNFKGKYKFTNWTKIHQILQKTYTDILPNINNSLHYINKYPKHIGNYIKPNLKEIKTVTYNIRNKTEFILDKLHNIIQHIFHSNATCNAKKIIQYSNYTENTLNRNTTIGFKDFYVSTLIFLIPTFHSFFYIFFMVQSCFLSTYQVYYVYKKKKSSSYAPCFKVISEVGLMLLWTGLLLSILCYLGALALSAVCRPLHTQHLYTQYIDNQRAWNNKTWLDAVVYPWDHNYKLKNILEKCSNNITVYQAFDVEKYWNVSMMFRKNKINTDNGDWIKLITNAVEDIELPNRQNCIEARDNFNFIEKDLAHLSPHIMHDVELFQNNSFKILLQNIIRKYSVTSIYEKLSQNLDIFNYIQNQNLEYHLSNFMEFKYLLKSNQKQLNIIKNAQEQMIDKIEKNMKSLIQNKVQEMNKSVGRLMENMERDLLYKIQYEIGNCQFYSTTTKITHLTICSDLPLILNMAWLTYNLNALIMIISIIISRNLNHDISKIRQEYRRTLKREAQERVLQQRQRIMTGTLLFDRRGQLLGNSRTLLNAQQ